MLERGVKAPSTGATQRTTGPLRTTTWKDAWEPPSYLEYILHCTLPSEHETACYANRKPYLYGVDKKDASITSSGPANPVSMARTFAISSKLES